MTLLALITEYRSALDEYNAVPEAQLTDAHHQAWWKPYETLTDCPPAPTSVQEALAAVRLVHDEEQKCGNQQELNVNLLAVALAFFDGAAEKDRELIELGRQFEAARKDAARLAPERRRLFAEYQRQAAEQNLPDWGPDSSKATRADHRRLWATTGYSAASKAFTEAHTKAFDLMKQIYRKPAYTLAGFAIKLEAVTFDQSDFEVDVDNWMTDVAERQLVRLTKAMTKAAKSGRAA